MERTNRKKEIVRKKPAKKRMLPNVFAVLPLCRFAKMRVLKKYNGLDAMMVNEWLEEMQDSERRQVKVIFWVTHKGK